MIENNMNPSFEDVRDTFNPLTPHTGLKIKMLMYTYTIFADLFLKITRQTDNVTEVNRYILR